MVCLEQLDSIDGRWADGDDLDTPDGLGHQPVHAHMALVEQLRIAPEGHQETPCDMRARQVPKRRDVGEFTGSGHLRFEPLGSFCVELSIRLPFRGRFLLFEQSTAFRAV